MLLIGCLVQLGLAAHELHAARRADGQPPTRLRHAGIQAAEIDSGAVASRRIVAAHLFGVDAPPPQDARSVVQATVPLTLTGVIAEDMPSAGAAIVGPSPGKAKFIRVGEEIVPGVTLQGVYNDHVVLRRAGELQSLALPHGNAGDGLYAATAQRDTPRADDDTDSPAGASDDYDGPTADQVSKKLAKATTGLSQALTATGVFEGVAYKGVRVQPGANPELFAQLGFHPGDMILNINGAAVTDPSQLSMLKSGRTVRVSVRRLTGTETLSIDTAALRGGGSQD